MKPEARDEAVRAAERVAEASRAEKGCVSYRFSSDLADPNLFCVFEEWESAEALDQHMARPHMAEFIGALAGIVGGEAKVMRYEVASSAPLF